MPLASRRRATRHVVAFAAFAGLLAVRAVAQPASYTPLTDLDSQTYLGFSGGLYPGGNVPPAGHAALGLARAALVRPLDGNGNPSSAGKIALLSIGMSNTTQEFCSQNGLQPCAPWSFVGQALADPAVNRSTLVFVNGARGGQVAGTFDSPADPNYNRIRDTDLASAGLTEAQVQVAWVKVANAQPNRSLPAPESDAFTLLAQMGNIARALKARFPNVQLVFFSSRIYAGYATSALNPEPYAYESGFAVKWLVQASIDQVWAGSVAESRAGDLNPGTVAPWIGWGAYLWANGLTPRSDGLAWQRSDLEGAGTHPSQSGEQKVGAMLLSFFKSEPAARSWFLAAGTAPPAAIETRIIPVVGSTPGAGGSFFKTSVQLHNPGSEPITGLVVFHPSGVPGGDSDPQLFFLLAARQTTSNDDLLPLLNRSGLGSADVRATSGVLPVLSIRVFNDAGAAGTTGFTEEAMRPGEALRAGQEGVLILPTDLTSFRFNLGVRTLEATAATLTVRSGGGFVVATVSRVFPATYHEQQTASAFLGVTTLPPGGTISVTVGAGAAIFYGATVDNRTGDPSMQVARAAP